MSCLITLSKTVSIIVKLEVICFETYKDLLDPMLPVCACDWNSSHMSSDIYIYTFQM